MQGLFEGLYLYEITLLILGAILFLVLIILLVVKVATRQPINVLISFFILPIFMIGFPGIQQFRFMNGLADLKMKTNQAIEEPENHELLAEIGDDLTNITKRPVSTPENLLVLGEAYEVLDRTEEARRIAYNIRERQPENDAAIQLQQRIELSEIISRVQENPQDERTRNELQSNITLFEAVPGKRCEKPSLHCPDIYGTRRHDQSGSICRLSECSKATDGCQSTSPDRFQATEQVSYHRYHTLDLPYAEPVIRQVWSKILIFM